MWCSTILLFFILLVDESRLQSIQFLEAPSDALVAPSRNHTLRCNVSSLSPVTITWFKDDVRITLDGQHFTRSNGTELVITGVNRATDEGSYHCEANSSSVGSVRSLEVMLRVAYIVAQPSSNPPTISDILVGNFAILSCPLPTSVPAVMVEWFRGSENVLTITVNNRFFIYSNETTSLLIISYFDTQDGNTYDCRISNNLVPNFTPYTLGIAVINAESQGAIPSLQHNFVVKPQNVDAVVGTTVKLQCFVIGQPVPVISWQKDNITLSTTTEQSGRVLIIQNVQLSDVGVYTCISEQNGFDTITTTATVSVIVPPRITAGVQYMEALVGDTVRLSCTAEGSSPITWEWRHNTVVVNNDDHYSVNGSQLNITNGQLSHNGIYQCIASHSIGGQDASNNNVNLTTKPPSFLPNGSPKDLLGIINSMVVLMCNATGAPSPQYVWVKDEIVFDTSSSPRFMILENSGSLQITSLQRSDAGVYRCNASNIARSISSDDSVLQVLDQPTILYQPTNFMVVENKSVTIPCGIVITGTEVEYFWRLNNVQLSVSSPRYMMREGNITVMNVQAEDKGMYECLANLSVADNMADDLQFSIGSGIISVIFLPGIVDMPTVSEIRSIDAVVAWTLPLSDGSSPPTRYIIEQRLVSLYGASLPQDVTSWMRVNTSVTSWMRVNTNDSLMSRVASLSPYTGYQFRVTAENTAGSGPPSLSSIVAITLEAVPTAAPSMLSVETRPESTELLVSWMAPEIRLPDGRGRNGIITNYSVMYQLDDGVPSPVTVVTDDNSTSLVLQGLMHSSMYCVMVAASTEVGLGPYTAAVTGKTLQRAPQPPDPPGMVGSNIVDSTTVTLQWSEPPLTTILKITGYQIVYRHPARENDTNILIVLPKQLNVTISGLDGGQLYLFNVSAVNMNGSGLPLVYTISTPIGSPTHILTFNGSRLLTNAVSLHWDVPPDGGSELYGFKIEGYSIYEREWLQLAVLPANVTEYHLTASDGMIYTDFRISAFNQYGCSEIITFEVGGLVMPKEDAPDTLWFLVIFVLFGLFLIAFGFLIATLISRKCYRVYSSGKYFFRDTDDSEITSSAPSTATFSNYDVKSRKASNIPLFSSETAPLSDINQPNEAPSSRTRSPMFSATDNGRSHLMAHGYPAPTSNPDGSTLTSGFSIDRPMFSDSTTVTSGESSGPFGHAKDYYHATTPQQMLSREYSYKTKSSESLASTYI